MRSPSTPPRPLRAAAPRAALLALALVAAGTLCACASTRARREAQTAHRSWSPPVTLAPAGCSGPAAPQVVFPQKTPFRGTGPGAIVFAGSPSCKTGSGPLLAPIGPGDDPAAPRSPATPQGDALAIAPPLAGAATTDGQIVIVGSSPQGSRSSAVLTEGRANGTFATPFSLGGLSSPLGLATAYLGDVAIASERQGAGGGVQIHMQRWFAGRFGAASSLGGGKGPRRALAVALDYRTDAIAVWWQHGWLWARERRANGSLGPLQRFARAGSEVQLTVLCSDDGRAIVAWVDPSGDNAKLYLDISAPSMRLGRGRLLERLRWNRGSMLARSGSVRLVRLSTESVLMAWTGTSEGRFVVRASGIDLQGTRTTSTLSGPAEDASLLDLATGPRGDAIALWRSVPASAASSENSEALMSARGVPSPRGVPYFGAAQQLAPSGRYSDASVALDPNTDRAVASWREQDGAIRAAVRSGGR